MNVEKVLIFDPSIAGISGDMILSALLDLGGDPTLLKKIVGEIENVSGSRISVDTKKVKKGEFVATGLEIHISEEKLPRTGREIIEMTNRILNDLSVSNDVRKFVNTAINILISTEAEIHGESEEEVDLHEAGSIDTLLDIIGSALLLENLNLLSSKKYSLPIAVGGGTITFSHGTVSVPAPATLKIFEKAKSIILGGPVEEELATPTGASILYALNVSFVNFLPKIRIEKIGYGAGTKDLGKVPNILRLIVGTDDPPDYYDTEKVYVVESDIDDIDSETLGYTLEKLLGSGAKDAYYIPEVRKKNRPGYMLRVITDHESLKNVLDIIFSETGTLGIRYYEVPRGVIPNRQQLNVNIKIDDRNYIVRVKISSSRNGKIIRIKPEYDDLKAIAQKEGIPLRDLYEKVLDEFKKLQWTSGSGKSG